MSKVYLDKDVYTAFRERINFIFDEFDLVCLSVSGGKDSSVMLQLTNLEAQKRGVYFDVMYIDLEAGFTYTKNHINELKKLSNIRDFHHFCIPIVEHNGSSIMQPTWIVWDEKEKNKWVHEKDENCINWRNIDKDLKSKIRFSSEWEDLLNNFPVFLMKKHSVKKIACLVGERTDESMNRFRSIAFSKNNYKGNKWSTKLRSDVYKFTPIYDWSVSDIWLSVSRFNLIFNEAYELMYKAGVNVNDQRICQPYGHEQKAGLKQIALIEPEIWSKILNRVSGANFGALYSKTTLLGYNGTEKPKHLTWEQYAIFLLESIGMYSKDLMLHYVRKIKILFDHIKENDNMSIDDISEDHKNAYHESNKDWLSWRRIAKCIERNDFACNSLSYGLTNKDRETMVDLKEKYGKMLGLENYKTKEMQKLSKEIGYEG